MRKTIVQDQYITQVTWLENKSKPVLARNGKRVIKFGAKYRYIWYVWSDLALETRNCYCKFLYFKHVTRTARENPKIPHAKPLVFLDFIRPRASLEGLLLASADANTYVIVIGFQYICYVFVLDNTNNLKLAPAHVARGRAKRHSFWGAKGAIRIHYVSAYLLHRS